MVSDRYQTTLLPDRWRGASFSRCGRYRYDLWREWGTGDGTMLWIMLNPSTATIMTDDPTVKGCGKRTRMWGFRRTVVCNLFAYRATDPARLADPKDPVGPENDEYIETWSQKADLIVAAWGTHGRYRQRSFEVLHNLQQLDLKCLGVNDDGTPKHPLYVSHDTQLEDYSPSGKKAGPAYMVMDEYQEWNEQLEEVAEGLHDERIGNTG